MNKVKRFLSLISMAGLILASCEGPMGPTGAGGRDGTDGKDANETCKFCHNSNVVLAKGLEYGYSQHFRGTAHDHATMAGCIPCHTHKGFLDVISNNTPATIIANPSGQSGYINNYTASGSALSFPGSINCFTCHSSLHTEYSATEFFPLSTTAEVPMTMWGGTKTINFPKSSGNLCAKCHQPMPVTAPDGSLIDYSRLITEPSATYNMSAVSYRTGVHYGTHGAMAAGVGGIEFGSGYSNSEHVTRASCTSCHMASPSGLSGGHSFSSAGNYIGCNTTNCHSGMSATNPLLRETRDYIDSKLKELAGKINSIGDGHDILQKDPSDGNYHGYIDIYDAGANPAGFWNNPGQMSVPFPELTNAQFGAIINYQLIYRDASLGVHNYPYIKKLLDNTIAAF